MPKSTINNVKLGIFVLAGAMFLILTLYMIGKNRSFFGSNYNLKAHFKNINGLTQGNNVRFSGIQVGTVKKIVILNDTLIEVTLSVKENMNKFIHKDDYVMIGGEGLMGNKVVNIEPSGLGGNLAKEGDVLKTKTTANLDEMLGILEKTNQDIAAISSGLKQTVSNINNSSALWELLNDNTIPASIRHSLQNVQTTTNNIQKSSEDLDKIMAGISQGKGSIGNLLQDTTLSNQLNSASRQINLTAHQANQISTDLQKLVQDLSFQLNNGNGPVSGLLKNAEMTQNISASLENINNGTRAFSENMEALKHNILFRGYFRKLEKNKLKNIKQGK